VIFRSTGYPIIFIQKQNCRDKSAHLFTLIYKFHSSITRYTYILKAEYHEQHVFALKFYAQKDSKSDYKYSHIINRGDVYNILITCLKVIPIILQEYPGASFGFIGSRTIDPISQTVEGYENTQRFRVYSKMVEDTIGYATFEHYTYEMVSGYLLINKSHSNVTDKEKLIREMFITTYNNLLDV
jgi:hypothetical protein